MIKFLFKGILRDKNRSLLPIIIIVIGVTLTLVLSAYIRGAMGDIVDQNAKFDTGHVKVTTRAYKENIDQLPNDLAILGVDTLMVSLKKDFPEMNWVKRIKFGGLIDVPDAEGNTRGQGPATGMALELFSENSGEVERMNIENSLVTGSVPSQTGGAMIGHDYAEKLELEVGDTITFVGSTMNGSMSFQNFVISGTIRFGSAGLDKGAFIIDVSDAQQMMDMNNAAGEILGYFENDVYYDEAAAEVASQFNKKYTHTNDEFAPVMQRLKVQNNLGSYLDYVDSFSALFVGIFVIAMSIVLWNTGLLGGLRRYQEFGIRLALGESKGHIYRSLVYEALLIGFIGSVLGTLLGLVISYYWQSTGIDIGGLIDNSSMMMPSVLKAKVTPQLFYIGFIPGLFAMVLGNMLSGIGIYKRETSQLFKELEV